jgi:hypothetical protein
VRDAQVRETLAESYFGEIALQSRFLQVHDAGPLPPPTMPRSAGNEREQHSRRIIFGERALQSRFLEVHHDDGRLPPPTMPHSAGVPSSSTGLRELYIDELASAKASLRHRLASSASATGSQAGHPHPLTTSTAQAAVSSSRDDKMSEERTWKLSHT